MKFIFLVCFYISITMSSFKRTNIERMFEEDVAQELPLQKCKHSERCVTFHKTSSPVPLYRTHSLSHIPSSLTEQDDMQSFSEWNLTPIEKREETDPLLFFDWGHVKEEESISIESMDVEGESGSLECNDVFLSEERVNAQSIFYDYAALKSVEPSKVRALSDLLGDVSAQKVCFLFLKKKEYNIPQILIEQNPELINARNEDNFPLYVFAHDNRFREFLEKNEAPRY